MRRRRGHSTHRRPVIRPPRTSARAVTSRPTRRHRLTRRRRPGFPSAGAGQPGYPPPYPDPSAFGGQPGYGAQSYPPPPPYGGAATGYPPPPSSYQGQGYPGGYGGGYGQPQPETNQLAIWSLVASLIGILCTIGSLVGIGLGVVALNQIKQNRQGGHGLAIAGIAVGVATLIISIIWTVFALS